MDTNGIAKLGLGIVAALAAASCSDGVLSSTQPDRSRVEASRSLEDRAIGVERGDLHAPAVDGGAPQPQPQPQPDASLPGTAVGLHGALKVKAGQLVDQHGQPVQLKGMSLFWHNWMGQYYNAAVVSWLASDWRSTVVRAAIGVEPGGAYLSDPATAKAKANAVIKAAIAEGIYVIIDWHAHDAVGNKDKARDFFVEMAQTYGGTPNVIYEIYNEPDYESWSEVKQYSIDIITAIRKIDPDNLIIVGSPHWDQDIHLAADDPIAGQTNLAYSVHFYAGTHGLELRDRVDYALGKGLCIFASEWGTSEADGGSNHKAYLAESATWLSYLAAKKISWCNWSLADKDEASAALVPGASASGGWTPGALTASGKYVRDEIRK
jgi:endoglucanase